MHISERNTAAEVLYRYTLNVPWQFTQEGTSPNDHDVACTELEADNTAECSLKYSACFSVCMASKKWMFLSLLGRGTCIIDNVALYISFSLTARIKFPKNVIIISYCACSDQDSIWSERDFLLSTVFLKLNYHLQKQSTCSLAH